MERYYGVITGYDPDTSVYSTTYAKKTANEFLNKLFKASKVAKSGSSTAINPIKILSNYTYLTNNGDSSQNDIINDFYSGGVYAETRTPEGEVAILADKTTGMYGANIENSDELSVVSVARFSDRLYLVVRPHLPNGDPINGWVRSICDIRIEHHYPYTVTPEPEENEGEEDEDPPAPEPVTVDHKTVFHLGSNNNNGNAPAVAYEITTTQSKDTLVKLAWCPADTPSSEKELKSHFTQWDICCYGTKIEGIPGARTLAVTNGKSHTADDFGAGGPIGGFIIHKMKNGTYKYGISVFNTDGSPLYTWSDNARPWDEFDSTGEIPRNVNHGGIGRLISKKTISEDSEETILKMAVLAPIFCPAANDQADTAKWMPQGLYDYSYFDKTGHIYLKKSDDMADSTPVFFADHGVYLLDGGLGGYQLTDRSLPESYAINTSVVERPQPSSWLPYYGRFFAIFDCKDGLSRTGWFNTKEDGEDYDMRFIGTPTINSDGSANFEDSPYATNSAWVPAKFGCSSNVRNASIMIAVVKFNNLTPWGDPNYDDRRYGFITHLLSYVPSGEQRQAFFDITQGEECVGIHHWAWPSATAGLITNESGSWNHWHSGSYPLSVNIDLSSRYIIVISPNALSNYTIFNIYKINSDGTYTAEAAKNDTDFDLKTLTFEECRFYLGSYDGGDTSWRTQPAQVLRPYANAATTWNSWHAQIGAPRASIDCSFLALADSQDRGWIYFEWEGGYPSGSRAAILNAIAQRYKGG